MSHRRLQVGAPAERGVVVIDDAGVPFFWTLASNFECFFGRWSGAIRRKIVCLSPVIRCFWHVTVSKV
jgi:hypothetical protein